jgi:outer membrane protein assembly factor BamB
MAEGRLYTMGWHGPGGGGPKRMGRDTVWCLDARTGREVWKEAYPCRYQARLSTGDEGQYGGPSSTPTFDAATGRLFSLSVDGHLVCWDGRKGGPPVWAFNLHEKYTIRQRPAVTDRGPRDYGCTGSPLVLGDLLIVEVGAREGCVVAFDKATGRERWRSRYTGFAGHTAGPVPVTLSGAACLATLALTEVVVMRTDPGHEGETVATAPWGTDFANGIATPAACRGGILATSNYNISRTALLMPAAGGRMEDAWRVRDHSGVGSPVVTADRIFFADGTLKCLDAATGKRLWSGGKFYHGSCVATGDGKILAFGAGRLALLDARADAYRELAAVENLFSATCYPHVALAGGLIAVKDMDGNVKVLSVRPEDKRAAAPPAQPALQPPPAAPAGPSPHDAPAPRLAAEWPGNRDGLVFVWATAKAENSAGGRPCIVKPRGDVRMTGGGEMALGAGAYLAEGAGAALLDACRKSGQLTVEALLTPANVTQDGPARIVTFSADAYRRNFTLGQERDSLVLRLRTPQTGENGMNPEVALTRLAPGRRVHVVVSYSPGRLACYVDGRRVLDTDRVQGDFANWEAMHLLFGDEWQDARQWSGTLSGVAIYSRALGADEAAAHHRLATGG